MPSAAGQGATKAHRIHLRHVTKQFRATEKRLAQLLATNAGAFLKALAEVRGIVRADDDPLLMMGFLLEGTDGKPYQALGGDEARRCPCPRSCAGRLALRVCLR